MSPRPPERPGRGPTPPRRLDRGTLLSLLVAAWGWVGVLMVVFLAQFLALLVHVGGDAAAVEDLTRQLGTGDLSVLPWGVIALSLLLQQPLMLLLAVVAWRAGDRLRLEPPAPWRERFALHRTPAAFWALGLFGGLTVGLFPGWFAARAVERWPSLSGGTLDVVGAALDGGGPTAQLVLGLLVVLAAPLAEELFFRGFLWELAGRVLSPRGTWIATSLMFAGFHLDVLQGLAVLPTALLLGWMRWTSGSLGPAVLLHVANNGVAVVGLVLLGLTEEPGVALAVAGAALSVVCFVLASFQRQARDPGFGDGPLP